MASILIIEDNKDISETTSEMLYLAGYKIVTAKDGKEGIDLAHNARPDIILCDIRIPEIDGYGVLDKLKENPLTRKIPFIFFSAHIESREIKKGLEKGAVAYICKPFTEEELVQTLERSLSGY